MLFYDGVPLSQRKFRCCSGGLEEYETIPLSGLLAMGSAFSARYDSHAKAPGREKSPVWNGAQIPEVLVKVMEMQHGS